MKLHKYPGILIAIEGLDGCGGNTQAEILSQRLKDLKIDHYFSSEPTDGLVGKLIHQILKNDSSKLSPTSLRLLFAADGSINQDQEIIPRLKKGEVIITDRYAWSSVAYGSLYLPKEWLFSLNNDFVFPDLTFFVDVSPNVCLRRLDKEKNSLELYEGERKLSQTYATYNWLAEKYWWAPIITVDGERSKEEIAEEIFTLVKNHPKFKQKLKKG